jgi:beta-glucosidase
MPSTPLFCFGHGLSYTTFDYGPLQLEADEVDVAGGARASVAVTNSGSPAGAEVVQLYAADTATGVTLPAQQLVGFARVDLEPGETKTVTFTVPITLLAYTGMTGEVVMEPGPVELEAQLRRPALHRHPHRDRAGPDLRRRGPSVLVCGHCRFLTNAPGDAPRP